MKRAISLGCALLAVSLAACQQTVVLDDLPPDAGRSGTGGAGGNGSGKGGSGPSDASTDGRCFGGQTQPIIATADRPLVVVALDRSSEMTGTQLAGSNNSEFVEAVNDLIAQVGSYAPSGQHINRRTIDFAYLGFPEGTTCGTSGCCASTADLADSYSAFSAATMTCDSPGNTCGPTTSNHPLSAALASASTFFEFGAGGSQSDERYVLVVTDDAPGGNCSVSMEDDCHAAQDQVVALYLSSVTTVVVFVGNSSNTSCFRNFVADQGGGPPPYYGDANLFYNAQNGQDLQDKIGTAIQAVSWGACHFSLSSTPSSPSNLTVAQGQGQSTTSIQQDPKNGWTYDNESAGPRLILHGNACNTYVMSDFGGLQIYDGCSMNHSPNP